MHKLDNSFLANTYGRLPISFSHGEGMWLHADDGKKYLDMLGGVAVNTLGHSHPQFIDGLKDQLQKLIHTSNYYFIKEQQLLAKELASLTKMNSVFFSNSGCEANEAAIKFARLYGSKKKITEPEIIVMENSFHGRTMATLTATGNRKAQAGFEPLLKGFMRVAFDDIPSIQNIAKSKNNVIAIMLEPIQGEGGVNAPHDIEQYLADLRKICDKNDWLLILDEVQTGIGRTGKLFAFQHSEIIPDILTSAKGLGSGVPIGATIINEKVSNILEPGKHGSTFGGNPLACRAGNLTLKILHDKKLQQNAMIMGKKLFNLLSDLLSEKKYIKEIRGLGLMLGIEFSVPCYQLMNMALSKGLLINVTSEKVVRLVPPLIISEEEISFFMQQFDLLLKDFEKEIFND